MNFYLAGMIVWFILIPLAILNASCRQWYMKNIGELRAHQLSSLTFSIIIFACAYLFLEIIAFSGEKSSLLILGFLWLMSTIIFEFIFGHFVMKHSWNKLLADYNICKGRLWSVVLLVTFFSPILASLLL